MAVCVLRLRRMVVDWQVSCSTQITLFLAGGGAYEFGGGGGGYSGERLQCWSRACVITNFDLTTQYSSTPNPGGGGTTTYSSYYGGGMWKGRLRLISPALVYFPSIYVSL